MVATGTASWYGEAFHGRRTANGEIFDRNAITAAHPTMPLPSYARVTNLRNQHSIIVRVNDRGPYHGGRVMDLSQRVADALDFKRFGTARIRIEQLGKAGLAGSDDKKLMATLRTDGTPAQLEGYSSGPATMIAEAPATQRVASLERPQTERPATRDTLRTPAPADDDDAPPAAKTSGAASVAPAFADGKAPSPPPRPFDLGTIPGAGVPIAAARAKTAIARAEAPRPTARLRRALICRDRRCTVARSRFAVRLAVGVGRRSWSVVLAGWVSRIGFVAALAATLASARPAWAGRRAFSPARRRRC
jgi:rare lipoprotein A